MEPAPLLPVSEEWNWQLAAACRGMDVEIFFHPASERRHQKQRRIDQAKVICNSCPVLEECRQHALRTREPYGIWGGLSEEERAEILGVGNLRYPAQRRRKRPSPDPIPAPSQHGAVPPTRTPEAASSA
jgi:WhiB family redox-sensing transcriptional regulator